MGLSYSTIDSLQHQHVALYLTSLTLRASLTTWTTHMPGCCLAYYSPPAVHVWLATYSICLKTSWIHKSLITPGGRVIFTIAKCPWLHVLCCHSYHLQFKISTEQCRIHCLVLSSFLCIRTWLTAVSSSSAWPLPPFVQPYINSLLWRWSTVYCLVLFT